MAGWQKNQECTQIERQWSEHEFVREAKKEHGQKVFMRNETWLEKAFMACPDMWWTMWMFQFPKTPPGTRKTHNTQFVTAWDTLSNQCVHGTNAALACCASNPQHNTFGVPTNTHGLSVLSPLYHANTVECKHRNLEPEKIHFSRNVPFDVCKNKIKSAPEQSIDISWAKLDACKLWRVGRLFGATLRWCSGFA